MLKSSQPNVLKETHDIIEINFVMDVLIKPISAAITDKNQIVKILREKAIVLLEAAGLLNRITAAPSLQ